VEVGATLDAPALAAGGLTLQAVGFRHRLADAVVRTTVPGTRQFVRVNRDEIRSSGIELLGAWHSAGAGGRGVTVSGDLLAQRVRVHDDSARAERRPEHQPELRGSLELGVPLPAMLRATAALHHVGAQYCVHPDAGAQLKLGAQTSGDVAIERRWSLGRGVFRGLRALLSLDNVADATVYDQCGLPQPGRTLRLGVQAFP
jgi:iron complex outermembrane receptor protein